MGTIEPAMSAFARNPETGEDQDFIYATLGDYSQSIPAYRAGFPPGTWSLPLVIIVSDDIQVGKGRRL